MDTQREELPRISVDTLQDWHRIKASYTKTALAEFEKRVASRSEGEKQALRVHMHKFIDRTFEMCKPNLRVNGKNFEDMDEGEEGIEPFDEGFDRHIWALSDQSLNLDGEIAKHRREDPQGIETLMKDLLERQKALDEKVAEEIRESGLGESELEGVKDVPEKTYEDTETVMRQTYAITEELQQCIVAQHERSERLTTVAAEIKALKP